MEKAETNENAKAQGLTETQRSIDNATVLAHPSHETPCPTCGGGAGYIAPSYVYAAGRIEPRFPNLSVEKELAQAIGRSGTPNLTDRDVLHNVLSKRENHYIVRQLCWVLTIGGIETYILQPRDPTELPLFVEAIHPDHDPIIHIDVIVGTRGPTAPPDLCNGLMIPIVWVDQIYSFDRNTFINAVPRPDNSPLKEDDFRETVRELFDRVIQIADNAGATDEHRALNFLALRYPVIYAKTAEELGRGNSPLTAVEVRPSPLSGVRKIVEVVLSYTSRTSDVIEKFFVRVDVTEKFPFLVTRLSPYYDR